MAGARDDGPGAGGSGRPGRHHPAPDGRHDDLAPDEVQRLDIDIPDDARDLDRDRDQWLAEEGRGAPLRPDAAPAPKPPTAASDGRDARRRRLLLTAAIALASMLTVAIGGAVGAWIVGPRVSQAPEPLASTAVDAGQVGGLLPADAVLQNGEAGITAQSLRPAVIALVPVSCPDCADLLTGLAPQAATFGLPLVAVGGTEQGVQLQQLADAVGSSRLITLTDPQHSLRDTYGGTVPTLLLVGADGVVVDVVHAPAPGVPLESTLVELVPGADHQT